MLYGVLECICALTSLGNLTAVLHAFCVFDGVDVLALEDSRTVLVDGVFVTGGRGEVHCVAVAARLVLEALVLLRLGVEAGRSGTVVGLLAVLRPAGSLMAVLRLAGRAT